MSSPTAPSTKAPTGASATSSAPETATSSARFARWPGRCSDALEVALSFPVGDEAIEEPLLGAGVVEVVVDDLVAERGARHRASLERRDRLSERRREALGIRLVRVALERRRRLELLLDAVQPGRDHRREGEVRIHVTSGNAGLHASRRAVADDAEAAGAVVVAPCEGRRRPAAGRIALVRVDGRSKEDRELLRAGDLAGEPPPEHRVVFGEHRLVPAEERGVNVARVPDPVLERL